MPDFSTVQIIAISILPILFAVVFHEVAHGYTAYLLGDKTARILGRLSFNPIRHIDLLGTIIVPILSLKLGGFIIGWAKPVPIDPRHFKKPRRDMLLVSLAGPMANLAMAIVWAVIAKIGVTLMMKGIPGALAIFAMSQAGVGFNLVIMVLNLLPIPPLDGSHVVAGMLPGKIAIQYERIAPYGFFMLLFLLYFGVLGKIISPAFRILYGLINALFGGLGAPFGL